MNPILNNLPQIIAFMANRAAKNKAAARAADINRFDPNVNKTKRVQFGKPAEGGDPDMLELESKISDQMNAYQQLSNAKLDTLSTMNKRYDLNANPFTVLSKGKLAGVKIPTELLNDVIAASKKQKNTPSSKVMGLIAQESTVGQEKAKSGGFTRQPTQQQMISGWDVADEYMPKDLYRYLADKGVKGISSDKKSGDFYVSDAKEALKSLEDKENILAGYKDYIKNKTKGLPKNSSVLDLAVEFLSKRGLAGYNRRDKSYTAKVAATQALLMADPKLRKALQ